MTEALPEDLFAVCANCGGTGSHFDTHQHRPGGYELHSEHCEACDGTGLSFTAEGERIRRLVKALSDYPKRRQRF